MLRKAHATVFVLIVLYMERSGLPPPRITILTCPAGQQQAKGQLVRSPLIPFHRSHQIQLALPRGPQESVSAHQQRVGASRRLGMPSVRCMTGEMTGSSYMVAVRSAATLPTWIS